MIAQLVTRLGNKGWTMRVAILVLVGVALGLPAAAAEGESGPYPIWWSPALELESLDQIEARLQRPLWADRPDDGFAVTVIEDEGEREDFAGSCADMLRLGRGHDFDVEPGYYNLWTYHWYRCTALERLEQAAQARESVVNDFVLDAAVVDVLPAMVQEGILCEEVCRLYEAHEANVSWREYETSFRAKVLLRQGFFSGGGEDEPEFLKFDVESDHEMRIDARDSVFDVEILARADFNDDGREDLMVLVYRYPKGGRGTFGDWYLLTRESAGDVFQIIGVERYLCPPTYVCD